MLSYSLLWLLNKLLHLFAAYDLDDKSGDCVCSRRVFLSHDAGDVIGIPWRKRRRAGEASITQPIEGRAAQTMKVTAWRQEHLFVLFFTLKVKLSICSIKNTLLTCTIIPFSSLFFQDQVNLVCCVSDKQFPERPGFLFALSAPWLPLCSLPRAETPDTLRHSAEDWESLQHTNTCDL